MVIQILRSLRIGLRNSILGSFLRAVGITQIGKKIYDSKVIQQGYQDVELMGQRLKFAISTSQEVSRIDSFSGQGEEEFVKRMVNAIKENDTCFDVGANIGVMSLLFAACHKTKNITVHGFEPEPNNMAQYERNISLNEFKNINTHNIVLGSEKGEIDFYVSGTTGSGAHSIFSDHTEHGQTIKTKMETGDDFCASISAFPDMMKIDVEGAEFEVLRGFQKTLNDGKVRDLFIEVHPETLIKQGTSPEEMQKFLEDLNYKLVWSNPREKQDHHHYQRNE